MKKKEKMKICFTASTGGHLEQLMLLEPLMNKYNSFIVTEKTDYSVVDKKKDVYYLSQINRKEPLFFIKFINNFHKSVQIFRKEKPDVIISTGVLATIPICMVAKLYKRKVIYIESFANISKGTKTGKLLYHLADRFYVQWDGMRKVYPKAVYKGGVY